MAIQFRNIPANQKEVFQTFKVAIQKRKKTAIQSDGTLQTEIQKNLQSVSEILDSHRRDNLNHDPKGILEKSRSGRHI